MAKMDGMLPGEYCEYGTVVIWPEGIGGDITPNGIEVRPQFFVIVTRARPNADNELRFSTEVMTTTPLPDGVIPHDVLVRSRTYYDRIVSRRRSDNARERVAARDGVTIPNESDDTGHLYEARNGVHLLREVDDAN